MTAAAEPLVVRLRLWIVLAFLALSAWLVPATAQVTHDDDVLAFLPPDHPDVQAFREVAARFGMLEVALVGLEAPEGQDLLSAKRVGQVRELAARLGEVPDVRMVLSFVDLPSPKVTPGGLEVGALVPPGLTDEDEIRTRVLGSRDAVGNLVSADGRAAALLVYLVDVEGSERAARREAALAEIRARTEAGWDGRRFYGGAPFAELSAAESSRADISDLSPAVIAVLAVASAVLLRSITAALINLTLAGLAVAWVMGAHAVFGEPLTIVSGTLPVMMVALGGAFGVHMLGGYQRQHGTPRERASATWRELWRPVTLSGLTTSIAFFALVVMPQRPMQRFGVAAGLAMLLLLALALLLLPAVLSYLPARALPTRDERPVPIPPAPPAWFLALAFAVLAGFGTRLSATPDTNEMFAEDSEPRKASAFFDEHFGGSVYLQVAVEADLSEPAVLRAIRDLAEDVAELEGVADVRSLVEQVAILNHALGGRRGVPRTQARAARVLTYLADHPAMAQLMTPDRQAAIVHIKLAPLSGEQQVALTERVRVRVAAMAPGGAIRLADTGATAVAAVREQDVRRRLERHLGRPLDGKQFAAVVAAPRPDDELLDQVRALRDRALDSEDSPVEGVPRAEIEQIAPDALLPARGPALEALLRRHLPTLVARDPEGVRFVAEHLGPWIDDAMASWRVARRCRTLGVEPHAPRQEQAPAEVDDLAALFAEDDDPPELSEACLALSGVLSELEAPLWPVAGEVDVPVRKEVPLRARVTGQPVIGQAFAQSVVENLLDSTLVSLAALGVVLMGAGYLMALIPALWTLGITAGVIALLGHPINVGTSMVSCIALGAGVDFAIHLGVRARADHSGGANAVRKIGGVILVSGLTLALAFLVLTASAMPPLQQFGAGLSVALLGAALGSVWWIPALLRRPPKPRAPSGRPGGGEGSSEA